MIRDELESQSGRDPLTAFELNLGRFTTLLIKSALDVTRIGVRGWEQVVRFLDQQRSGMVLIKPSGEDIGDLVESLRKDGPDAVRDTLTELAAGE